MAIVGLGVILYIGGFIFVIVALIYLIIRRIESKKKEDFEKRNN